MQENGARSRSSSFLRIGCQTLALLAQLAYSQFPTDVVVKPFIQPSQVGAINKPVFFTEFPNLPNHFLLLEQHTGAVCVLRTTNGQWVKEQFLKLTVQTYNEMGLLGFAFHPKFSENRKYYVVYNPSGSALATMLEERQADATFLKDSGNPPRLILRIEKTHANHNGGTIAFGRDGYLFFGVGDGFDGVPGSTKNSHFLGTILRIDVDNPANDKPYGIPADNPLVSSTNPSIKKEIWAFGLRNPWKWSLDPLNGDLWAGEVGDDIEEVDLIRKGEDMGWGTMQGTKCYEAPPCNSTGLTPPIMDLSRADAKSVIGGFVYRGNVNSPFYGAYVFGDHYTRKIWALTHENRVLKQWVQIALSPSDISSFGTDAKGNIYVVGYNDGRIHILEHSSMQPNGVKTKFGKPVRQGAIRGAPYRKFLDPAGLSGAETVESFSALGVKFWAWDFKNEVAPPGPLSHGLNFLRVRYPDRTEGEILHRLEK